MKQRYFLTDLDGTLLRSDASLSAYTVDTLIQAMSQGAVISYATARSYTSSNQVVSAIPWKYPLVLYNGALLFDPERKVVVYGNWLGQEITNEIIQIGKKAGLTPLLFSLDEADNERVLHEKLTRIGDVQFFNGRPNDPRFHEVAALNSPDTYRTLIITYIGFLSELESLKDRVIELYGNQLHIHLTKDPEVYCQSIRLIASIAVSEVGDPIFPGNINGDRLRDRHMGEEKPDEELMGKRKSSPRLSTTFLMSILQGLTLRQVNIHAAANILCCGFGIWYSILRIRLQVGDI